MEHPSAPAEAETSALGLRRLAGDTGVYALATAAGPVAALIAVPVLARELGPSGFGTVDLLVTLTAVSGMVATMGMDGAAARSYFDPQMPRERRPRVVATAIRAVAAASAALALAIVLAVAVLGAAGADLGGTWPLVAAFLTFPLVTTQAMVRNGFRFAGRARWFAALAACSAVVGSGTAVALVVGAGLGPAGYFLGLGAGALAALALGVAAAPAAVTAPADRAELRVMLRFGLPLVPASIAVWTLLLADRAVVGALRDVDEVGLYGVGARAAAPLFLAVQAFLVAWIPFSLRAHRDAPDSEPVMRGRVATLAVAGATSLAVALAALATPLVELLGGPEFDRAVAAVLPLAVAWIGYAASGVGFIPFTIERRSAAVAKVTGACAAGNLVLALALVPAFGFAGAAWATAAAYTALGAVSLFSGQRILPAALDLRRLCAVAAVAAAALPAAALADDAGSLAGRAAAWAAATALLAWIAAPAARPRRGL